MRKNENKVLDLINIKKTISVPDIYKTLKISESTARRAVTVLSDMKLINRYHGGAQSIVDIENQKDVKGRMIINPELKDNIARTAAMQVCSGQTVILLGGTTVYMMCKYIINKNITVLTNSMLVFDELKDASNIRLILLGGTYNADEMELEGVLTNFGLKLFNADCMFFGTNGFDPNYGFLTSRIEAIELYRGCINASRLKYALADSSKLFAQGPAVIATCENVDYLITDTGISREIATIFTEKKTKVIYSDIFPKKGSI